MVACTREVQWYYHIVVGLVTFLGGLLLLLPCRAAWYIMHKRRQAANPWKSNHDDDKEAKSSVVQCCSRMRANAQYILSGHSPFSKFSIILIWLVNLASIILYLVEAAHFSVDDCGEVIGDLKQYVWLGLSACIIAHYITRFAAAPDKVFMWIDLYSVVDHFTIGPIFMGLYLNTNWLGLKFLRILYLLQLPEVLQMMHILKTKNSIRACQAGSIFLTCWMTSAGFVHITENNGDPHHNYENAQFLTYWECLYWLLVTMSTVGFGEIYPTTDIGRAFIVLFIMGSFAMFTSIIPELVRSLGRQTKYQKPYKRTYGKKHIVVCGHITTESVSGFIRNFLHEDASSGNIDVVFLDMQKPSLELEAFFKRHFNDVNFVQGTAMDLKALQSVKLRDADACLILANRQAIDPDEEDAANIMRATAIKNFHADIRVIIQLLQYHNKMSLLHIPNWKWDKTDSDAVVCVSELKNGILAQNCLAPGIATLLSNLFTMRSYKHKKTDDHDWLDAYKYGAGYEIYAVEFSPAFLGMTFSKAAEICYARLGVLLLAVDVSQRHRKTHLKVNPGEGVLITAECTGFFVAQTPEQVHAVSTFNGASAGSKGNNFLGNNPSDHNLGNSLNSTLRPKASTVVEDRSNGFSRYPYRPLADRPDPTRAADDEEGTEDEDGDEDEDEEDNEEEEMTEVGEEVVPGQKEATLITAGVKEDPKVVANRRKRKKSLHLVVLSGLPSESGLTNATPEHHLEYVEGVGSRLAISGEEGDPMGQGQPEMFDITGMVHWCQPRKMEDCVLTPDDVRVRDFRNHVVVCLNAEATGPESCLVGLLTPLRASSLRTSELKDIILVGHLDYIANEWTAIACFPNVYVVQRNNQRRLDLRLLNIQQCDMCVIMTAGKSIKVDQTMLDKDAILSTLSIRAMCGQHLEQRIKAFGVLTNPGAFRRQMAVVSDVPLITELEHEGNVSFLDAEDADDPNTPLFMTQSYMCGTTFVTSVLDSLLSCTYLNGDVLTLIRALVTGGESTEFENVLAVGLGIVRKNTLMDVSAARQRCRLAQLSLSFGPLEKLQHNDVYGELFIQALRTYNIICLGIHHQMKPDAPNPRDRKRVVLTNPIYETKLHPTDRIYVLLPFEMTNTTETCMESDLNEAPSSEGLGGSPRPAPSGESLYDSSPKVRFSSNPSVDQTEF